MTHNPYLDWMQLANDNALTDEKRHQLNAHLAECAECTTEWEVLTRAHTLLVRAPLAAPRTGFTGRFKARLRQQRSQPRTAWGFFTLGLSAVGGTLLSMILLAASFWPLGQLVGQPAATAAVMNNVTVASRLAYTLVGALWVVIKALGQFIFLSPTAWAAALAGLLVAGVWLYMLRRLNAQGLWQ